VTEDPDQDLPCREPGQRVAHALGPCERVVLEPALLEARSRREVVVRSEGDSEEVGVVRALVGGDPPRLRVDRRDALLAELDARLRDLAVVQRDILHRLLSHEDGELREAEAEGVVLVEERDANLVRERLREPGRELQAREAGSEDHDVLHRATIARGGRSF
jgi:hypothetical protein